MENLEVMEKSWKKIRVMEVMKKSGKSSAESWNVAYRECVFLVAEAGESTRKPVLVFIHGESYEWNSGNAYDGSVLAAYADVVVVTVNYRLGILGKHPPVCSVDTVLYTRTDTGNRNPSVGTSLTCSDGNNAQK
ncbi:Neuroligin-2 [Frankliniella fusca]|uniref:Neuroligin-2 n=1 Tax=Frankliniella fusca TaxID=407009 RepID=A0AAE1GZW1_9NEOP|nr:Neuroligin-2 [Frankliniella fusca]